MNQLNLGYISFTINIVYVTIPKLMGEISTSDRPYRDSVKMITTENSSEITIIE